MRDDEEASCTSDEESFESLVDEDNDEESSYASSSFSEYHLDDDDDEKEKSLNFCKNHDDDEDSLQGLIDPDADEYELKPARLNKSLDVASRSEVDEDDLLSSASVESFGGDEEEEENIFPNRNISNRDNGIVAVVEAEEIQDGDETDDDIMVVEAEIVYDEDNPGGISFADEREPENIGPTHIYDLTCCSGEDNHESSEDYEGGNDETAIDDQSLQSPQERGKNESGEQIQSPGSRSDFFNEKEKSSDRIASNAEPHRCQESMNRIDTAVWNSEQQKTTTSPGQLASQENVADKLHAEEESQRGNANRKKITQTQLVYPEAIDAVNLQRTPTFLKPASNREFIQEHKGTFDISALNKTVHSPQGQQEPHELVANASVVDCVPIAGAGSFRRNGHVPTSTIHENNDESVGLAFDFLSLDIADCDEIQPNHSFVSRSCGADLHNNSLASEHGLDHEIVEARKENPCQTDVLCAVHSRTPIGHNQKAPSMLFSLSPTNANPKHHHGKIVDQDTSVRIVKQQPRIRREGNIKRGQWRLVKKIGEGSFGVVHMGINTHSGAMIAVKSVKMEPIAMKDSKREIQLLKTLDHDNIVKYFGAEMNQTYLHIFQEWIPAGSIASLLGMVGPFPLGVLREYLQQILQGLAYLHENNVMHRDIKGSNLLVTDKGVIKLADFGAGKQLCQLRMESLMAMTCRGTPFFMAPEVFEQKYSAKADIWSVGCVGVQMATGKPPWKDMGFSSHLTLFRHVSSIAEPPLIDLHADILVGVHDGLDRFQKYKRLVGQCFNLDPSERPSAREMLQDSFFHAEKIWSQGDESECSHLFSPSPNRNSMSPHVPVQTNLSPISWSRRKSGTAASSPFLSPPLPPNTKRSSITPDTSDWPLWAKQSHANALEKAKKIEDVALDPFGSLSYSIDAQMKENRSVPKEASMVGESSSALLGLDFVLGTNISGVTPEYDS